MFVVTENTPGYMPNADEPKRNQGGLTMKTALLSLAAFLLIGSSTAIAQTEDSPGWQCARMGDRFCGGKTAPVRFAGRLVLVRGFKTPRHALSLYNGRRFNVGRFATDCKPKNPYVIRVDVGDTTYAVIHACKHVYSVALS